MRNIFSRRGGDQRESASSDVDGVLLDESAVVLDAPAATRDEAIEGAGRLLVAVGAVDEAYVAAMHERELSVPTFMGNGLALPHGTADAQAAVRRTSVSLTRYAEPVDWGGEQVRFVVGLAGKGSEHLDLIGRLARVFTDDGALARLDAATSPAEVVAVLDPGRSG